MPLGLTSIGLSVCRWVEVVLACRYAVGSECHSELVAAFGEQVFHPGPITPSWVSQSCIASCMPVAMAYGLWPIVTAMSNGPHVPWPMAHGPFLWSAARRPMPHGQRSPSQMAHMARWVGEQVFDPGPIAPSHSHGLQPMA